MLTIRITYPPRGDLAASDEIRVIEGLASVEYIKTCPYLQHAFVTDNPRQKFCTRSHKNAFWKKNRGEE